MTKETFKHGQNLKFIDKKSVFIDPTVVIGDNVTIYENNRIEGNTVIGDNTILRSGNYLKDSIVGKNVQIEYSHVVEAQIDDGCLVGPYSRLRPNAHLMQDVHVGDFVEIKNATLGKGTKANHLAYVGDADVGEGCNVGCGVIFVNYNGRSKNRTKVGNNVFLGSNSNVIAPVEIADNVYICAGTTVTQNLKEDDFVIGRSRQEVKENRAHNYLKEKK